jgi:hypothetical protein
VIVWADCEPVAVLPSPTKSTFTLSPLGFLPPYLHAIVDRQVAGKMSAGDAFVSVAVQVER